MAMWEGVRITLTAWFTSPDIPPVGGWPVIQLVKEIICVYREETEIPGQNLVCISQALNHPMPMRRILVTSYPIFISAIIVI